MAWRWEQGWNLSLSSSCHKMPFIIHGGPSFSLEDKKTSLVRKWDLNTLHKYLICVNYLLYFSVLYELIHLVLIFLIHLVFIPAVWIYTHSVYSRVHWGTERPNDFPEVTWPLNDSFRFQMYAAWHPNCVQKHDSVSKLIKRMKINEGNWDYYKKENKQ